MPPTNRLDRLESAIQALRGDVREVLGVVRETRDQQLRHDPEKAEEERKENSQRIGELEKWRGYQTGRGQLLQWLVAAIAGFVSGFFGRPAG